MANPRPTTNDKMSEATVPLGRVMTSFRSLPEMTEQEQERLLGAAMEKAGLGRFEPWEVVEPYTTVDSVKNTWQTFLQKAKRVLTGKVSSPDSGCPTSPNEAQEEESAVLIHFNKVSSKLESSPSSNRGSRKKNGAIDEDWTILGAN